MRASDQFSHQIGSQLTTNQMNKTEEQIKKLYRKFRKNNPSMLVGRDAEHALRAARILQRFNELEEQGLVRMVQEPEEESYFGVYGEPDTEKERKEIEEIIERLGCWWTASEYFDGDAWEQASSCGMHTGYVDPLDPFENCYVIDEMAAAIEKAEEVLAEPSRAFDAACRDIVTIK